LKGPKTSNGTEREREREREKKRAGEIGITKSERRKQTGLSLGSRGFQKEPGTTQRGGAETRQIDKESRVETCFGTK